MKRLVVISALICLCNCLEFEEKLYKLIDSEWQCETICGGFGGKTQFLNTTSICKCTLDDRIDDIDIELMLKNARNHNLQMVIIHNKIKRGIDQPPKFTTRKPIIRSTLKPIKRPSFKPITPRHPTQAPHKIDETYQKRLKELHDRMEDLRQSRKSKTEPQKTPQRAAFETQSSKILEQLKERRAQREQKLKNAGPKVGAVHVTTEEPKVSSVEPVAPAPKDTPPQSNIEVIPPEHKGIVTQDPRSVDGQN